MAYPLSTCMLEGRRMPYDPATREALFNGRWWDFEEECRELAEAIRRDNHSRDAAEDLADMSRKEVA